VSKGTYYSVKRDLLQCQKRPATVPSHETAHSQGQKRPTTVSKETYYSVKRDLLQYRHTRRRTRKAKRDLLQCQKRPTTVSKETCYSTVTRDGALARPKETYYSVKRDLLQYRHTRRRTRKASRAGLNLNLKTLNPGPKTGVHARRTRNASPVGDLFKKACDNIGCVFVVLTVLR